MNQTDITRKGQRTGERCAMGPLQSYSCSLTHTKLPSVSSDLGCPSLWKPLKGDPPGFAPWCMAQLLIPLSYTFLKCMWSALLLRSSLSLLKNSLFPRVSKHHVFSVSTTYTEKQKEVGKHLTLSKAYTKVRFLTQFLQHSPWRSLRYQQFWDR